MTHFPHAILDALMHRNIADIDELLQAPSISRLTGSVILEGMADATDRILLAVREREPILLFGDYDCDGVLGTGILLSILKKLGGVVQAYLPHRDEGYGFSNPAAFRAAREGFRLIVTIDNGVHAGRAVTLAARLGVEVVIVDHHHRSEPMEARIVWSDALSGAALAWMLAAALLERVHDQKREEILLALAPFAAIAGVADCVPLVGPQRVLVRLGMEHIGESRYPALHELLTLARVPKGNLPTARDIGFGIAPRINAAGRMAHPKLALQALFSHSVEEAKQQVLALDEINQSRKALEQEVLPLLLRETPPSSGGMLFYGMEWPKGIAGILAARAAEHFHRPVIVLVRDLTSSLLTGSGRSARGVDLYAAVARCAHLLERFGGHAQAIGLALRESALDEFREAFQEATGGCVDSPLQLPSAEAVLNLSAVSHRFWEACLALEPFGTGFPPLVFRVANATFEKHQKGRTRLGQGGRWLNVSPGKTSPNNGEQGDFLVEVTGNNATLLSQA